MLGIASYQRFIDKMTQQSFPETSDRTPYPSSVYFSPFGGFWVRYPLGMRYEDGSAQLAPQTASLKALVKAMYWAFSPNLLAAIFAVLILGHAQLGWFPTLTRYRELLLFLVAYLMVILVFYLAGVALLTRGLKAERMNRPLSDTSKKFLMEHGMSAQDIHRAQAFHKSSFQSHLMVSWGEKAGWGSILFITLFLSPGFFVGWDLFTGAQPTKGMLIMLGTALLETFFLYILWLKIRWHRMGGRK